VQGTWEDLNRRLVGALLALDLHDSLVIGERRETPRKRLFGSLLGHEPPPSGPRRFVQITAAQNALVAECVGSTRIGGDWEMSEETEAALLKQGWERPWLPELTTFQREAPLVGAPRLALATVRALQALGCEVEELEVELTREEP
jgi:hypothetical protein